MATNTFLSSYLHKVLKEQEKEGRLSLTQNTTAFPLSTGQLALDYFYNGGILPRFYTFAGPEQSGKSLCVSTILAAAYKQGVDALIYFDAEETLNNETLQTLFNIENVDDLITAQKQGKEIVAPKLHIIKGNSLEGIMDATTAIIDSLPDKIYNDEEHAWFFKFKKSDKNSKTIMETLQLTIDDKVTKKYGCDTFIFCKDPKSKPNTSGLQAIIVIDSLAMLQADAEKEDGPTQQMALEARRFAKHLKRFAGNLNQKQVAVLTTNHVRDNPNAMFGPKEYEPGGSSIKYAASVQTRINSISSSTAGWGGNGPVFEEDSVLAGDLKDRYQFKRFKLIKDKVGGGVNQTVLQRVWLEDSEGRSWGFDPVLDTLEYLIKTNQLTENRGRYKINIPILQDQSFTFKQFKKLVLATAINDPKYQLTLDEFKEEFKLECIFNIRQYCFDQIQNGGILQVQNTTTPEKSPQLPHNEVVDPETGEVRTIPITQI